MFADKLKQLRKRDGLTQQSLANMLGVTCGTVGMWETNRRKPTMESVIRMCKIFDTTCDELLGNQLPVPERTIEKKLVEKVKARGGLAPKFVSPGWDGVPDRMVLLPEGLIAFVELKAPGKKLRPQQMMRKKQLESLGFMVFVVDSIDQINNVLYVIGGGGW